MIMIDLEGVLSDHTDRLALLQHRTQSDPRDRTAWKKYYAAIMDDEPRTEIMDLVHDWLAAGIKPLVYSTRFANKYNHEREWLKMHGLWGHVDLIQRMPAHSKIKGPDLVAQWVDKFRPTVIIDDREEVRSNIQLHAPQIEVYNWTDFEPIIKTVRGDHGRESES